MKNILTFAVVFALSSLSAAVRGNPLPDGSVELSNRFLKAAIHPAKGARVVRLTDLRSGVEYAGGAWDLGIGGELDWQERKLTASVYYGKPYNEQLETFPDKVVLRCERTGSGAVGQWITIYKTYTLMENSTELTLDYRVAVNPAAMTALSFCLWLHNSAQIKNEAGEVRFVKKSGVTGIAFNAGSPRNESFHYDLADGWFAFSRKKAPEGLILQVPHLDLMCFYNWQGQQGNTMEILFRSQKIPAGKEYATRLSMVLYDKLQAPDGAGSGFAGAFSPSGIRLYSANAAAGKITVSFRTPPEQLETPIKEFDFSLKAGAAADFALPPPKAGTETVVRVIRDGKVQMTMRRPNELSNYLRQPETPRRGSDAERYGQVILNAADRQDCYTWHPELPPTGGKPFLKPDAAGKLKLLVVTDMKCGREVTELANRMDADVSSCTFGTGGQLQWHPVWGHTGGRPEMNLYLGELLQKDYDVILLGGVQIDVIGKDNLAAILAKVQKGTGLVSVMPSKIPESARALFPAKPLIAECFKKVHPKIGKSGAFRISENSPVKNFPFEAMPRIYLFPYETTQTALTSGGAPFLATGAFGRGRTALFAWLSGRPDNTRRAGLVPFFASETALPWHETFYGMLIQAVRWSAGRAPKVAVEHFSAAPGKADVVLNNRLGREIEAELTFSARHEGKEFPDKTVKKVLKPGLNQLSVPLDYAYLAGTNLVELRVGAGKLALDFAIAAVNADAGAKIGAISVPAKLFPAGRPFPVKAELSGDFDRAFCELIDPDGRIIARSDLKEGKTELTPRGVYRHRAELFVTLEKNRQIQDRKKATVDLIPESELSRDWNTYNVMISWPVRDTRAFPFFLRPVWERALRELGVNLVMVHGIPTHWGQDNEAKFGLDYRYGGQLVMESIARLSNRSGIKGFNFPNYEYRSRKAELAKILENYAKTRDKFTIKRYPRLDDPAYLNAYEEAMKSYLPSLSRWKPYMYDLGDEMSYGEFLRPIDFDFSPESLTAFRLWLKERYRNDLTRLNTEWKRGYSDWNEVVPDTGLEARERKVFSAWALHRIYNTTLFAGFWKHVGDAARRIDPGARISASGTPGPHPYNAYDYELLLPTVDSLAAYTEPGTAELFNSFKKLPLTAWVGYGSGEKELWNTIWNNAFNGHFGTSLYSEMVMLNPDLTLTDRGKYVRDALLPLREGVGMLLYNSVRPAEAAILYSTPSMMAAWADYTTNDFADARTAWLTMLKRNQCNARFITPQQLGSGAWKKGNFKVLVLPMALALSDAEAKAVSDFAAQGGLVLADVAPGKYNENVAPARPGRIHGPGLFVAGDKLSPEWSNKFMKKVEKEVVERLRQAGIGAKTPVLKRDSGNPEINTYALCPDGGEVFGVWTSGPGSVELTPPAGGAVYAVLAKKAVSGKFDLRPDRPELFIALPYRVKSVAVTAKLTAGKLSAAGTVLPDNGKALRHVLNFRVFDQDGKELAHLRRSAEAPSGKAEIAWPLALNEAGPFRVEVSDVISGVKGTTEVRP